MTIKVGINGFGRIGRSVFRILSTKDQIEVVAVNDLISPDSLAHLLKYDTVMGRFEQSVEVGDGALVVGGKTVKVVAERDPANLPWGDLGVDVVVDATGIFRTREALQKHLDAGAKKVVLTVPPKDAVDNMVVLGVNCDSITPDQKILSNASCTTNCLAPVAKALDDAFGIEYGIMTTVHAYTNDQVVADGPHSDLRRARAAAQNIIPTTTRPPPALGKVLPNLNRKLDGIAQRVPVVNGSIVDLNVQLAKDVTKEEVNAVVKAAADGPLKGILEYTEDPIVSSDIIMNPHSSIFDAQSTLVPGGKGKAVKILSWYDNEWATRIALST